MSMPASLLIQAATSPEKLRGPSVATLNAPGFDFAGFELAPPGWSPGA